MKLRIQDTCLICKFVWMFTCTSIGCLIWSVNVLLIWSVNDLSPFLIYSQKEHRHLRASLDLKQQLKSWGLS